MYCTCVVICVRFPLFFYSEPLSFDTLCLSLWLCLHVFFAIILFRSYIRSLPLVRFATEHTLRFCMTIRCISTLPYSCSCSIMCLFGRLSFRSIFLDYFVLSFVDCFPYSTLSLCLFLGGDLKGVKSLSHTFLCTVYNQMHYLGNDFENKNKK